MAIDAGVVKDLGLQAAVLVLVFGYQEGEAAILDAIGHALQAGPWAGLAAADVVRDPDEGTARLADPAREAEAVAAVLAFLASDAGVADVETYVAANFRDLGPTGVGVGEVGRRVRERFGA